MINGKHHKQNSNLVHQECLNKRYISLLISLTGHL